MDDELYNQEDQDWSDNEDNVDDDKNADDPDGRQDDLGPLTGISNTAPIDFSKMQRTRALVKTTDESVLHAMDTLEVIATTYGSLHEELRRMAEDLMSTFRALHLELDRYPGRVLARVIRSEPDPNKRLNKAIEARQEIHNLVVLLQDDTNNK